MLEKCLHGERKTNKAAENPRAQNDKNGAKHTFSWSSCHDENHPTKKSDAFEHTVRSRTRGWMLSLF